MELQDYLRVFRAHWLVIVAVTVLGGLLAFGWTLTQSKVYTATGSAIITTGASQDLGSALVGDNYAKSRVKSYLDIAKSRKVAEFAAGELGLDASPDALIARVTVTNPLDTAVLRVAAKGSSPEQARDLAEAWIAGMTAVVADLENEGATDDVTSVVALQTLDSAVLPSAPTSPNVRLAVALGLLVGLALGIGYALVRAALDRRLRKSEDIEREFDVPVVGALPFDAGLPRDPAYSASKDFAMKEAVRQLRTNLQFMDVDNPPRVLVITSALPGDGKSTVAIMLAEAIADSGQDVVLVDADLRRPVIAKKLRLVEGGGLTDVLVGRATTKEVLQAYGDTRHFFVLASGAIPPNPSELLASDAMKSLLYGFPEHATIIIDTPPLIPVTDAAVLTARTDGALVVARSGRTTIDVLDRALQNLDKVKGRALGVILNSVPRKGAHKDQYAYSYEYKQAPVAEQAPAPAPEDDVHVAPAPEAPRAPRGPKSPPHHASSRRPADTRPEGLLDWDHVVARGNATPAAGEA
ncbi:polysaccharide biosynthesis tyrosine autokinase [Demequina iriomotensis]|uniref:polysaccharide biosynthesis tyrosine autokinase n=1 Tax=Demequina iriomotensis TaxID=1536641 RepID=UPI000781E189|nr:polysaccharide biosynthesis tyrosine autokinase [Demequina iriomotensis]